MSTQARRTLYLHVGAPKCASTTLQSALAEYRGGEMTFPEVAAHSISMKAGVHWLTELEDYVEPVKAAADWQDRDCILSHETFYAHFDRTFPILRELFPSHLLRVLIIERDVNNQIRSTLAQWVRTCMQIPTSRQRLEHYRQIGPAEFKAQMEALQKKARTQWTEVADSYVLGDVRDVAQLASEWLGDSAIIKHIGETGRKNISLSEATVEKMLAELDTFNGTPEEWRALARKFEG